ncbi:hypothetical protein I4F81_004077 [Pyropia yezoensis]|uniref:Uncharacterized protein n=1 Tax=Pyropia yezoensis TaxID=2788 RepID=A0ACC3BV53_PYRYE|nr:hypothetical protein I4F81_004077 [Neopyropia yezoensis]|eukprot:contig_20657_g5077
MEPMEHIIVVGDPGAGKSTILNGLCGAAPGTPMPFRSGLSVASGMTTALQTEVVNGVRYSDTPGLDDVELKERAAAAIADAIRLGGAVRLLFVLTMEAGRIRGSNLATIRIVLDALTAADVDIDHRFSVVVNKMTSGEMAAWGDPRMEGAAVLRSQLGCAAAVDQLVYLPRVNGLVDSADAQFPGATRECLVSAVKAMAPMAVVAGTDIVVQVNEVDRLTSFYESELAKQVREREEERKDWAAQHQAALQEAQRRADREEQRTARREAALQEAERRAERDQATLQDVLRVQQAHAAELEGARKWNMVAGVVAAVAGMVVFKVPMWP